MSSIIVERPKLTTIDLVKISVYAKVMGNQAVIDEEKGRYLIIRENTVGYIQKKPNGSLYVLFKDGTKDDIDKVVSLNALFDKYNLFPEDGFNFEGVCKLVRHGIQSE